MGVLSSYVHSERVFRGVSTETIWTLVSYPTVVSLNVREQVGLEVCRVTTIRTAPSRAFRQLLHLVLYHFSMA